MVIGIDKGSPDSAMDLAEGKAVRLLAFGHAEREALDISFPFSSLWSEHFHRFQHLHPQTQLPFST